MEEQTSPLTALCLRVSFFRIFQARMEMESSTKKSKSSEYLRRSRASIRVAYQTEHEQSRFTIDFCLSVFHILSQKENYTHIAITRLRFSYRFLFGTLYGAGSKSLIGIFPTFFLAYNNLLQRTLGNQVGYTFISCTPVYLTGFRKTD